MAHITRRQFLAAAGITTLSFALTACGGEKNVEKITSIDQLYNDKIIGVQLGTTSDAYSVDDFGADHVEKYNKSADAVQALKTGKIDAVIVDNEPAKRFVEANSDLQILETPYADEDYSICLAKGSEMTEVFNQAIAELKQDGTMDAILDKYLHGVEGAVGYVTPEGTTYPNGTLVMATNATFPPYEYYQGDEIVGLDVEFATAICDKLGYQLQVTDMEFDAIIPAVSSGKCAFGAAGMTVNPDRLKNADFTDSYCTGVQSIIVKK